MPSLVIVGKVHLEKMILNFVSFFLNFHYNLPLEKRVLFHINKLSQLRDKFGSNYPSGFGEKKLKFLECIFAVSLLSALALSQV